MRGGSTHQAELKKVIMIIGLWVSQNAVTVLSRQRILSKVRTKRTKNQNMGKISVYSVTAATIGAIVAFLTVSLPRVASSSGKTTGAFATVTLSRL